jgi:hypothetical protein
MALPTAEQCKLKISFDIVAQTMTVYADENYLDPTFNVGMETFTLTNAKLTDPLGTEYTIDEISLVDTPSVVYSGSQTFSCPLDSNNLIINGAYNITVGDIDLTYSGFDQNYPDVDSDFTLSYVSPTITVNHTINCITPSFVSEDTTVKTVIDPNTQASITPTIGDYAHNLSFPAGSDGGSGYASPILTDDITITRGKDEFYQGTQTTYIMYNLDYVFSDGLILNDVISDNIPITVDCATLLCGAVCGLNSLYTTMEANKIVNTALYLKNVALFQLVMAKAALAQFNIDCGNSSEASTIITDIKKSIGNCCDDCDAETGTPISGVGN